MHHWHGGLQVAKLVNRRPVFVRARGQKILDVLIPISFCVIEGNSWLRPTKDCICLCVLSVLNKLDYSTYW